LIRRQNKLTRGQNELTRGQNELTRGQNELTRGQNELTREQNELTRGQNELTREQNKVTRGQNKVTREQNGLPPERNRLTRQLSRMEAKVLIFTQRNSMTGRNFVKLSPGIAECTPGAGGSSTCFRSEGSGVLHAAFPFDRSPNTRSRQGGLVAWGFDRVRPASNLFMRQMHKVVVFGPSKRPEFTTEYESQCIGVQQLTRSALFVAPEFVGKPSTFLKRANSRYSSTQIINIYATACCDSR
jgi:hypothetical protein